MPTYSLTLRSEKESRLSIEEMDNNLLYLQELALSGSVVDLENVTTDIIPSQDSTYNLGTSASQWKSLHVSGQTIYIGGVPLSTDNGSLVVNSINLGTTASPLILSADNDNKLLLNGGGYRGFYSGINRFFGDDPNMTQVFISKSVNAIYKNKDTYETDSEDFYVTGLSGSDTVVILNIYGLDVKKALKVKHIRKFVEKFVDIVLYTNETLNLDLAVIRDSFYDNIELLTSTLPVGSLYNQFVFQDRSTKYVLTPSNYTTNSMTGSGTFSLNKSLGDNKGYNVFFGEGGLGLYGFEVNDTITISGTAIGGQSPANDATIYVNSIDNGVIDTFEIYNPGTGYTDGLYNIDSYGDAAYANITTASGSVIGVELFYRGTGYEVLLGEGYTIQSGGSDALIRVLSIKNGVVNNYDVVGIPDYRSPYRNSENPWPVMHIVDGGNDQHDNGNYITTDKSITQFIGSIEQGDDNILTVTKIISGTISVGQTVRHNEGDYEILTGTLTGGIGTYSISSFTNNDLSEQLFTAYGINYGGGEIVESNTFGTGSSYITLYDESIFAMVAINADVDKVWYIGDSGSDGSPNSKKEVNVLIADNNTLSFGDEKLELFNKDVILPEIGTLGWMSVCGPLYNYNYNVRFTSTIIDDFENTYAAGNDENYYNGIVVKFNKEGDKLWSIRLADDDNEDNIEVKSIQIDPANGDLVAVCSIYTGYLEGLIVRMDPMSGYVKLSHRLKDLNDLEEQGTIILNDMTFNSDNELIIVGEKSTDYLEWTIGTSSVLLGSTNSTLIISPNSIDNNLPQSAYGWSIAGTGISSEENLAYINTFFDVAGSLTPGGSSASFTILSNYEAGNYTILSVDSPGTGYSMDVLKPIVVPGTSLGGATPDNDATIIQASASNGGIVSATITGTPASGSGTQSFTGVTGLTIEGSGAVFNIVNNPTGYLHNGFGGNQYNYVVNDTITIPGNLLGGTGSNDCIVTVTSVDNGVIQEISLSGTGSTASLYLTTNTNVDFSASGTWSIYKSLNGEAYIYTENWERTLIGDTSGDTFESVITDENNNIYCVGTIGAENNYNKAIISKFNQAGVQQWTKVLNEIEQDCYGDSVAIFGTNSVIATHYSSPQNSSSKVIISKLTFDGILIWQKRTEMNEWSDVVTDSTGIYIAVDSDDNNFDNNVIKLFKLNSDGAVIWNNTIGSRASYYLYKMSIKNEKISIAGNTLVMADDYTNAFIANLPTDGTLASNYNDNLGDYNEISGITNYVNGDYVIQSVTSSFYESITPQVATHSITYTRDRYIFDVNYNIDNNIDKINEEGGIIFGNGTKQTSSSCVIPQNYQPYNGDYYLKLSDIGKHIYRDTNTNSSIRIPTNSQVPFPIGTTITIVSGNGNCNFFAIDDNITKIWGDGYNDPSNGSYYFYIGQNAIANLLKIGVDKWIVSSSNLYYYD